MLKKAYMVGYLKQSLDIRYKVLTDKGEVVEKIMAVPCTWADGQVGAFAVFADRAAAEAYQNGETRYPVIEWEVDEPTRQ